jgi:hypothetical protein
MPLGIDVPPMLLVHAYEGAQEQCSAVADAYKEED